MKAFVKEFKEFISRGNVIDMAVGVIMGSTFTKIVTSLVNDVVMPSIGLLIGDKSFEEFKYVITEATETTAESAIYYGKFIQNVVDFLLVAIVVFVMVKLINKMHKKEEPAPAATTTKKCPYCMSEIAIEATKCPHCTSDITE